MTPIGLPSSYGLASYELRAGSFAEDSRGRWYLNVQIKVAELVGPRLPVTRSVGNDLGLKTCATASDPDGHPKLLHLWPVKLLQVGRSDGDSTGVTAMREAASFKR